MDKKVSGIHHITAVAGNPQQNVDFYVKVLGQRLVKTTVNFDDPGTYHFYYGDEVGNPGTILTFFPWRGIPKGEIGNGEVAVTAYSVPEDSLGYWQNRLKEFNVETGNIETRFGEQVLPLADPDGMRIELVAQANPPDYKHWDAGPIPADYALRGFQGATMWVDSAEYSALLLTEIFGYEKVNEAGQRHQFKAVSNERAITVDLLLRPGQPRGRLGAGSVHHIAFRVEDDETQLAWRQELIQSRLNVTEVKDRQYFHSIYFREPSGVLYEMATDPPGFTWDEDVAELGTGLKLPPWLESDRERIARSLPVIERPTF